MVRGPCVDIYLSSVQMDRIHLTPEGTPVQTETQGGGGELKCIHLHPEESPQLTCSVGSKASRGSYNLSLKVETTHSAAM